MTLVKVCGVTREEDALAAVEAGADFVGFVFANRSPRCVSPDAARSIVANVRGMLKQKADRRSLAGRCAPRAPREVRYVGVFVDESPETVNAIVKHACLDVAQLHGAEPAECVGLIDVPVIKAFGVGKAVPDISAYAAAAWLLFDTAIAGSMGGSGRAFDWSLLRAASPSREFFLAGGLTPDNVGQAVRSARPFAVDVSSGVEASPGIKDAQKVRSFIDAVRREGVRAGYDVTRAT